MAGHKTGVILPQSRLRDIFPQGLDNKSSTGTHYTLKPEQLYYSLVERYDPDTHVESIIVKTISYGKAAKSTAQEFLLVQIEDAAVEGLVNYLILDRSIKEAAQVPFTSSQASFTMTSAIDQFRVSYDGDLEKLLRECQLQTCKYSESLQFSSNAPLYLYELVVLAAQLSNSHRSCHAAVNTTPGFYTQHIWACLQKMRTSPSCQDDLSTEGGKPGFTRHSLDESEVTELVQIIQGRIKELKLGIARQKLRWEKLGNVVPDEEVSDVVDVDTCPQKAVAL